MSDTTFEPGWLMRTCHEAHIRVMSTGLPSALQSRGFRAPDLPISEQEAVELFEMMDKRFRAWTGRGLGEQVALMRS